MEGNPRLFNASLIRRERWCDLLHLQVLLPAEIGDVEAGQFAMIETKAPEATLLRPFSIFEARGKFLGFLMQVRGKGTASLSRLPLGTSLKVIAPLGRGFPLPGEKGGAILVAGGVGIASLYPLALNLRRMKAEVRLLWGTRNSQEIPPPLLRGLERAGVGLEIATEDGSEGKRGMVTDLITPALLERDTVLYACGPREMLRKVAEIAARYRLPCWVSLEERMACGLGACLGCVVETKKGYQRTCREGPVFPAEEIVWQGRT